ncbi:MAG: DUF3494 domain-containing protein [Prolixibacteraceae bacterium]|nr:DUF3494 domain-containing protein [Prolixibacteraceae bacterium]
MKKYLMLTNGKIPPMLKHKGFLWFFNSTWIMLLLLSTMMWQCEKDTFEGETKGVCPEVISSDPADGTTNVVTNKIITATFNEAMEIATINGETFTIKQGTTPVSGIVTYADKNAIFTPTGPLEANKTYTGTITKRVKDPAGNFPLENYVWNFSTGNVPKVIATDPEAAASSVPLDKIITVTFSTTMDPATINGSSFLIHQGTNPIAGTVNKSVNMATLSPKKPLANISQGTNSIAGLVSYSETTATFTPTSPLEDNKVYTGTITTAAKDLAGNAMASHYKWSFSTAQTQYTINLSSNPVEGGSTSGGGLLNKEDQTTVVATPATGYTFANWTEGSTVVSSNASYSFTATANRTLVANFTIYTFTLNVTAANGSVVKAPNQTTYSYGTLVQLTATPNAGYSFTGWSGDATGASNSFTILMNSNKNVTANFALIPPDTYVLNVSSTLGGTAVKTPNQASYTSGTNVQVTATPNTGYTFSGWSGDATGSTNPLSVTMNSDKNIVANFTLIPIVTYTLNITANNGVVVKNPNLANYNSGATVQLTATPNTGYEFSGWSGDANGSTNPLTVTMNSNKNITANFTLIPADTYTLNVTANNGTVVKNPNQVNYNQGASVQLTASPNTGYEFLSWGGDATGTDNPLTVIMDEDKEITANFSILTYSLTVISENGNVVKNPEQLEYNHGENVELTATANSGYMFDSWSGDATGSNNPITVVMDENKTITANYVVELPSGPAPIDLNSAGDFAVLAGSGISNTGVTTMINGDVGSFPTATINGLLPGNVNGTLYTSADPIVGLAKEDLTTAYNDAQSRSLDAISLPGQIGGLSLAPGLYVNSTTSGISGTGPNGILTLDAGGNSNAVWIFKVGSTFITDAGTSIVLAGGAQAGNIYWSVGTSATLGTNSVFYGNILADQSITLTTGATLYGRALTRIAAISLDTNTVTKP